MTGKAPWGKALAATAYGAPALVLVTVGVLCFYPLVYAWKRLSAGWTGRRIARHFIWLYGRAWRVAFSPFVRFVVRMPAARDFPRPCIVVCNHLSVFDIYSMSLLPVSDVAMTVRSWPFRLFWNRPFMRLAGYLDIEGRRPEDVWHDMRETLAQGGVLVFFPEGHRSRDGSLQRFRSGAFKLAVTCGAPVVPVCIQGTDTLLPPGGRLLRPATVRIHALPPVAATEYTGELAHGALRKHVKARMAEELAHMRAMADAQ